ncbi:MAG TPA: tetratricopeptide repeat protein, partial [Candidatus Limnocylindrales bacterium]|nr:tetratricopeptide repeat protein [Candidatus Limnocylindrales bacterium]
LGGDANRRASTPGGPATPPVRQESSPPPTRPVPTRTKSRRTTTDPVDVEPSDEELAELIASVTPSAHRDSVATPNRLATRGRAQVASDALLTGARRSTLRNRLTLVAGGIAIVAIVAFAGYRFGGGGLAASLPAASPAASGSIDLAAVSAYMQRIATNSKDTEALQGLADLYYGAADYASATDFLNRILADDPQNIRALLGLGAAAFNDGDSTAAETAWKKVVAIDPKSVEAHYDLGFLYLNLNDLVSVKREWELVVQLDPGSDVAKNVQDHLDAIAAQASPSAGSSSTPAASPAASPVPSGSARRLRSVSRRDPVGSASGATWARPRAAGRVAVPTLSRWALGVTEAMSSASSSSDGSTSSGVELVRRPLVRAGTGRVGGGEDS